MAWSTTGNGYNMYQLLSALQKDIRRGNEEQALFWAVELEKYDYRILWNRLMVIASEDIGAANPNLPVVIETLRHHYEDALRRRNDSYRVFLTNAILILSRSKKSRVTDDLLWKVYGEIEFGNKRLKIPEYAKDKHSGMRTEGNEKWIREGTKLKNEIKFKEDGNPVNPYTEEANRIRLEYGKLPEMFPRRRKKKVKLLQAPLERDYPSKRKITNIQKTQYRKSPLRR